MKFEQWFNLVESGIKSQAPCFPWEVEIEPKKHGPWSAPRVTEPLDLASCELAVNADGEQAERAVETMLASGQDAQIYNFNRLENSTILFTAPRSFMYC